jgi:hypothetical protein
MEDGFGPVASTISSRAVAITAYFFVEDLCNDGEEDLVPSFAKFFQTLLVQVNEDLARLANYEKPTHPRLLEDFQKYISQASVEPYAIRRRHRFLIEAFAYYRQPATKGQILQ